MDIRELRIGNIIETPTQWIGVVNSIRQLLIGVTDKQGYGYEFGVDLIDPIPITPEWIERLGFERGQSKISNCFVFSYGHYKIHINAFGVIYFSHYTMGGFYLREVKFVHQIQNLIFALTGEELTIK